MSTHHEKTPGPLWQARYMSSPEFAELHGISGVATSARAAILLHAAKRNLILFIQGLSLAEGGLRRVARELVEMFPKRLADEGSSLALREHGNSTQHFSAYDLSKATVSHVHRAIYDFLLPSDKTFVEGMEAARQTGRKSFRKPARALPDEAHQEPREPSPEESRGARRGIVPLASGRRGRAENPADLVAA